MNAKERVRVLVIDGDASLRTTLVDSLVRRGYLAEGIEEPLVAADRVSLFRPQVVLCELALGDLDGLDLMRRLKQLDEGTQVVFMTADPEQDTVDAAFAAGASGYLIKPFQNLRIVFDAVAQAEQDMRTWEETVREEIRRQFPEEYRILYTGPSGLPVPQDLDRLIAQVEEASSPEEP